MSGFTHSPLHHSRHVLLLCGSLQTLTGLGEKIVVLIASDHFSGTATTVLLPSASVVSSTEAQKFCFAHNNKIVIECFFITRGSSYKLTLVEDPCNYTLGENPNFPFIYFQMFSLRTETNLGSPGEELVASFKLTTSAMC